MISPVQHSWNYSTKHSIWDRLYYLRLKRPSWIKRHKEEKLRVLYDNLENLLCNGVVIWGHIIQVNEELFESGWEDLPGEVVYSLDDRNTAKPQALSEIAEDVYRLKGEDPTDPELKPIAHYLTDEYIRVFGLEVPTVISSTLRCRISTTMFIRKHLPNRSVNFTKLPLIVHPEEPYVVLPLPYKYWSDSLIAEVESY